MKTRHFCNSNRRLVFQLRVTHTHTHTHTNIGYAHRHTYTIQRYWFLIREWVIYTTLTTNIQVRGEVCLHYPSCKLGINHVIKWKCNIMCYFELLRWWGYVYKFRSRTDASEAHSYLYPLQWSWCKAERIEKSITIRWCAISWTFLKPVYKPC
jgi:hypothetical protein